MTDLTDLSVFDGATPGPWVLSEPYSHGDFDCITLGHGEEDHGARFAEESLAEIYSLNMADDEFHANARLISQAPTLLAEVKRLRAENEAMRALLLRAGAELDEADGRLKDAFVEGCCIILRWTHSGAPQDDLDEAGYDYATTNGRAARDLKAEIEEIVKS